MEYTPNKQLYKWSTTDTKRTTIIEMAKNAEKIDEALNTLTSDLADKANKADNAISPEDYNGNALQKIQSAVNDAISQSRAVRFSKMYDITGLGSIILETLGNRRNLYLIGVGGGITKNDAGYIFTATTSDRSDIISQNMQYRSIAGAGTKVWDGNKIINIKSVYDSYNLVDQVVNAESRWLQGFRLLHCTVIGGSGWAVSMRYSMDCSFENNVIENRDSFIRNKYDGQAIFNSDNQGLRIVNNCIESLSGSAMYLGSAFGVKISGNYFEANQGGDSALGVGLNGENANPYIDLSANKYVYSHMGLEVTNNNIQVTSNQVTNHIPSICWGFFSIDVHSSTNVTNGRIHDIPSGASGKVVSIADFSMNNDIANDTSKVRIV